MQNPNSLIQGIVILIIGLLCFFAWKDFAKVLKKYSFVKYGKLQEVILKICFYTIGSVGIVGGAKMIIEFIYH